MRLRFKISMSLDGFVAGPRQSVDDPLGIGGERLHEWVVPLAAWRSMVGLEGGEVNESTAVVEESVANIGATVMAATCSEATRVRGTPAIPGTGGGDPIRRFTTRSSCSPITRASRSS
jgi:hypothetical protein